MKLFILIILLLINSLTYSFKKEKIIFNNFKNKHKNTTPKDFIAIVTGKKIKYSLKKIPKESYCKGKKPKVRYLFLKGIAEKIIIENVENPFVNRFQNYLELYQSVKSFLDYQKNYNDFIKIFEWIHLSNYKNKFYVVKMRKHYFRKLDYFHLYINKKNYKLQKIIQFNNKIASNILDIFYHSFKGYRLISKIWFNNKKNINKKFKIEIYNHKINVGLTQDHIINAQDDCPNIKF